MFAHHPKVYCRFVHMHRLSNPLPLPPCQFVHVHSVCCRFVHASGLAGCLCDGAIPSHNLYNHSQVGREGKAQTQAEENTEHEGCYEFTTTLPRCAIMGTWAVDTCHTTHH